MFARLFATNDKPYIPGWDQRRRVEFDLSGVRFSLEVPDSNVPDANVIIASPRINIFDPDNYPFADDRPDYTVSGIESCTLMTQYYETKGALIGGVTGAISLAVSLEQVRDLPEGMSCLSSADFIQVVDRDMYFRFGPPRINNFLPRVPVDWRVRQFGGIEWFSYMVMPDIARYSSEMPPFARKECRQILLTPIDSTHFIRISITIDNYDIDSKAMPFLITKAEELLGTIVFQNLKGPAQLSLLEKDRSQFIWVEHELQDQKHESGAYRQVVARYGTPPPEYHF